ncbi:MAG TPA: GAF domain-containing protein, partial [Methylomirabilota bacterium]
MSSRLDERTAPIRIGLIAGGPEGVALLQLVLGWPAAEVVVVVDPLPDALVLQEAKLRGIPAATRHLEVFSHLPVELVVESTGQAAVLDEFLRARPPGVEVVGSRSLPAFRRLLRDLTKSLEQQTATGEILRVISSSPTDVQPVFDTIARSALQLCDGNYCFVFRFDGELLHLAAHHGASPEGAEALRRAWPMPPSGGSAAGRSVLSRGVAHIPDVEADSTYVLGAVAAIAAYRATVAVPMLRDGVPIGTINVSRERPGPFSERQIELLKTFADQAVIAIENVRLFKELEARNRDLTETLEQQTATSEILRVISSSPTDVQPVFRAIVESAIRLCAARFGAVFRFDGELVHLVAHQNLTAENVQVLERLYPMRPSRGQGSGRAILSGAAVQIEDALADPEYRQDVATAAGWRSMLVVPMLREGNVVGTINVHRAQAGAFPERQVDLLKTFADQAVIAIENVRLFKELEARNHDLTDALEQQTATSEILRVISSSPTDIQPVLDAVTENAARLCDVPDAAIFQVDGDRLRLVANRGPIPHFSLGDTRPIARDWVSGRAVSDATTIHVADLSASENDFPQGAAYAKQMGHRTTLATPLLREGAAIGVILIRRLEVRPFATREIEILKTFADQAVIAIENVRLFKELEAKNRDLTETLEQQTATSEILRVISSSPTDVQPVFDTIAANALRLCDGLWSAVTRFDGELIHLVSHHNVGNPSRMDALRRAFPRPPREGGVNDQAILTGTIAHVA